jgi:TPR repeat protein
MAKQLQKYGFYVILKENVKTREIGNVYREFRTKITPGGVALVFYAGHGLQVKGQNYFPAVDSEISSEEDVPLQSLNLGTILDSMDEAKAGVNLVFLDACRDNPFVRRFRSAQRGLAKIEAASGTLIHYATRPGSVAADGHGRNGTYTEALLTNLGKSGIPVELMLKKVTNEVVDKTKGQQEPWIEGSLRGDFYFVLQGPTTIHLHSNNNSNITGNSSTFSEPSPVADQVIGISKQESENLYSDGVAAAGRQNYVTARSSYERAAASGHARAQFQLGTLYAKGQGGPTNMKLAEKWFRLAADSGEVDAVASLGTLYAMGGDGVDRDFEKSFTYFKAASSAGNARGMNGLATMYAKGLYVKQDVSEAVRLFGQAAELGDAGGKANLGVAYMSGAGGVKRNPVEAVRLWREASEAGNVDAQYGYGSAYFQGVGGLSKDLDQAEYWLKKAAEQGHPKSIEFLQHIKSQR